VLVGDWSACRCRSRGTRRSAMSGPEHSIRTSVQLAGSREVRQTPIVGGCEARHDGTRFLSQPTQPRLTNPLSIHRASRFSSTSFMMHDSATASELGRTIAPLRQAASGHRQVVPRRTCAPSLASVTAKRAPLQSATFASVMAKPQTNSIVSTHTCRFMAVIFSVESSRTRLLCSTV